MPHARSIVLVVHGGAGIIVRDQMTPGLEAVYLAGLTEALRAGHAVLRQGGTALDAVETAIVLLEDAPQFNAGRGSVFTHEGTNEMDASLMDGKTRAAGAVAGVATVKNPIRAARAVMERSPHVLLSGRGADQFARERGLEIVDPSYFRTEAKWNALQRELAREAQGTGEDNFARLSEDAWRDDDADPPKFGTVGAAALDRSGNLAAGTSSGGMTNKRWGRVGDSPLIGAGTWADNATCAVSATGHGEFFIRNVVAHDIHARMAYKGETVEEAARAVLQNLGTAGGAGGVIVLDVHGNAALLFNTPGMYRGTITGAGDVRVAIFGEE